VLNESCSKVCFLSVQNGLKEGDALLLLLLNFVLEYAILKVQEEQE